MAQAYSPTLNFVFATSFVKPMPTVKQQLFSLIKTYNQGRAVNYPAIDRKMMVQYPELVKAGQLGAILDEMVAEDLLEQLSPSSYQIKNKPLPSTATDIGHSTSTSY